jgi:hypothetical protein
MTNVVFGENMPEEFHGKPYVRSESPDRKTEAFSARERATRLWVIFCPPFACLICSARSGL